MFRHAPPPEVSGVWEFVLHGLKVIQKRCYTNWQPEDVKARLLDGRAGLFICEDGFVILEIDTEQVSERRFLNVWISWFKPGALKKRRSEMVAWLDDMTIKSGCEWHQFTSPRMGWQGAHEYEVHMITWRRKAK